MGIQALDDKMLRGPSSQGSDTVLQYVWQMKEERESERSREGENSSCVPLSLITRWYSRTRQREKGKQRETKTGCDTVLKGSWKAMESETHRQRDRESEKERDGEREQGFAGTDSWGLLLPTKGVAFHHSWVGPSEGRPTSHISLSLRLSFPHLPDTTQANKEHTKQGGMETELKGAPGFPWDGVRQTLCRIHRGCI